MTEKEYIPKLGTKYHSGQTYQFSIPSGDLWSSQDMIRTLVNVYGGEITDYEIWTCQGFRDETYLTFINKKLA